MDWELIDKMIEEGFIKTQVHPTLPLLIHNYTPKTQFDRVWNAATKTCRGLITTDPEKTGKPKEIVGRPFGKFFNLGEVEAPNETFEVMEKMDGSLFIACVYKGELVTATRGSFTSDQSVIGREELLRVCCPAHALPQDVFHHDYTYLFEVIYAKEGGRPQIVVDYGPNTKLTLLTVIHTESGSEVPYEQLATFVTWGETSIQHGTTGLDQENEQLFEICKRYDLEHLTPAQLDAMDEENREGFVLKFSSGQRIKIKFEWYKIRHKLLCGLTPRRIWEVLKTGGTVKEDILLGVDVPDEFHHWLTETAMGLYEAAHRIRFAASNEIKKVPQGPTDTRKDQALYIKENCTHPHLMFSLLDGRMIEEQIWKMLKPTGGIAFHDEGEDA